MARFFIVLAALIGVCLGSILHGKNGIISERFARPLMIGSRVISQNLYIDNPYHDAGSWGIIDLCADGSFVNAIEVNYQEPDNLDETAINAIKLYCVTPTGQGTGYVTSSQGSKGSWFGMKICTGAYVTGFRANVLEYQGIFTDDVAVQDMEVDCKHGREIIDALPIPVPPVVSTKNFKAGEWSTFAVCDADLAVCGLQTRYEDGSLGDEAAIVDIVLFCCAIPVTE